MIKNKRNFYRITTLIMSVLMVMLLVGCTKDPITVTFDSFDLESATVDTEYSVSIANAEITQDVVYEIVEGSLPKGLTLSNNGLISGVPTEESLNVSFTIEVSGEEIVSAQATFNLSVIAEVEIGSFDYIMEAELTYLDDKVGAGPSNAAPGVTMIRKDSKASNGHYIADTYMENLFFEFEFTADTDSQAVISVSLGSDIGEITLTKEMFEISINDVVIDFPDLKLRDSSGQLNKVFTEFTISTGANILAGDNVIILKILENELVNNSTGGPLIDYVKVTTTSILEFNAYLDNIA